RRHQHPVCARGRGRPRRGGRVERRRRDGAIERGAQRVRRRALVGVSGAGVGALARESALGRPAAGAAPTAGQRARRNIRYLYLDMGWQRIILAGITTFLSVFLVRLGASPFLVGLLTSVPALVTIVLSVVFAPFLEGRRDLVRVVKLTRLGSRLCYLLIALVPFALTGDLVWLAPWVIVAIWGLSA